MCTTCLLYETHMGPIKKNLLGETYCTIYIDKM
jgi:hypothetical protein